MMLRRRRKTRTGRVVSSKMDKTVVVAVEWRQTHPLYNKSVKRITKFHAHDEDNGCKVGDVVSIMETRPLSRKKRWRVNQILSTGDIPSSDEIFEIPPAELEGGDESDGADEEDEEQA
jgi:small subunit ribosomal protein S17